MECVLLVRGLMAVRAAMGLWGVLLVAPACAPSQVIGPLQRQGDERDKLLLRAKEAGTSEDVLKAAFPPFTRKEAQSVEAENASCQSSYLWKNGLTWTGSVFVATAAGLIIGGAYATGNNDSTGKLVFGVSAGSLAALGSALVAVGGIIQQGFSDRGCWVR